MEKVRQSWKKLNSLIKQWMEKIRKYVIYTFRVKCWLYLNRWRWFRGLSKKHFGVIRRVLFLLTPLLIAYLINKFGGVNFSQETLSNYLVAIGAMTGGIIAIVFTISIFLLQNTADLYSSQYLEVYIHDWKEKFIYFVIVLITIFFLGGGLYAGGLESISQNIMPVIIYTSLFLIGGIFSLIDWQYENVRKKINPAQAINFLEKESKRFLKGLQSDAEKMAGIIQAKDGSTSNDMAIATAYNYFLQPFIKKLDRDLENLVEISLKLSDREEIETTKRGLLAVHNIMVSFFEARKTSSLIIPSTIAFLAMESDSQTFLTSNFERLNRAGEKFTREGKDEISSHIINIYDSLANKAKEMSFIGRAQISNPILDHIIGYLNAFIDYGMRAKNLEIVFQGSRVLGNFVVISSEKGLQITLHGLQDRILEIAKYGLAEKQTIIVDNCVNAYLVAIEAVFVKSKIIRRESEVSLRNIATIAYLTSAYIKIGILPNNFTTWTTLSKGYDYLYSRIVNIVNYCIELEDAKEKERCCRDIIELFKDVNLTLRKLSENLKECDSTLCDSISRLTFNINQLLVDFISKDGIKEHFDDEEVGIISRLEWNIHLPYWFVHHSEKFNSGSNPFNTLTNSVAKTGILAIEKLGNKKLAIECINCLNLITNECLKKTTDRYGYDEPRVLEKACYLGILALKKGWEDVAIRLALFIYDFEKKYYEKYLTNIPESIDPKNHNVMGLPHHDQLLRELLRWRDDFTREKYNGVWHLMDSADDMMYPLIDEVDIDRFIFEVWNEFPSGSQLEEEIELKVSRGRLAKTLNEILVKKNGK